MSDVFEKREKAFEEVFFAKLDEERIAKLRARREQESAREQLAGSTGISDPDVLQRILDLGVGPHTLEALNLVPLVSTAWASGEVTDEERDAVLKAAEQSGLAEDAPARELLELWLRDPPGPEVESAWADYLRAVLAELDEASASAVKGQLMERCHAVAAASGGFLGIGSVSKAESAVMERLAAALG